MKIAPATARGAARPRAYVPQAGRAGPGADVGSGRTGNFQRCSAPNGWTFIKRPAKLPPKTDHRRRRRPPPPHTPGYCCRRCATASGPLLVRLRLKAAVRVVRIMVVEVCIQGIQFRYSIWFLRNGERPRAGHTSIRPSLPPISSVRSALGAVEHNVARIGEPAATLMGRARPGPRSRPRYCL